MSIAERIEKVQARLAAACEKAGRAADEVQLIAVSKKKPPEAVREAAEYGLCVFGENRVQEAAIKIPTCPGSLQWHLIGHLQSNKAKLAARLFHMVHSVDSEKLLRELEKGAAQAGKNLPILLQLNLGGETSKSGLAPEEALSLAGNSAGVSPPGCAGLDDPAAFCRRCGEGTSLFCPASGTAGPGAAGN